MDPGTGLMVYSCGPSEPEAHKLLTKSKLELAHNFLEKPHVRHALKYMPDEEQREKVLEVALAWKDKFAAEKWKTAVAAIETIRKEDNIRLPRGDADVPQDPATVSSDNAFEYAAERARTMSATSALAVSHAIPWPGSKRIGLLRQHIANLSLPLRRNRNPSTPRLCRWDVLTTGPVTPLSLTPVGNSFAGGSTWDVQTPQFGQSEPSTPVTAMLLDPEYPFLPHDAESRAAYTNVKGEVDALARKYCMARFNTRTSNESDDFLPHTMIKPKDIREAARMALDARNVKLKEAIIKDLPDRLQRHAAEKSALLGRLCITSESELGDQNDWMNNEILMPIPEVHDKSDYIPPSTRFVLSILDEQREALRMFRKQSENGESKLSKMAVEAAWAVQILEDAERLVAAEPHSWSSDTDDDDGYSYGNFLRSIKSEMSTSSSSGTLSSMVDELSSFDFCSIRSRSNTNQTVDSVRSRASRLPRSSTSTNISADNRPPARLRDSSSSSSFNDGSSSHRRPDLRIATQTIDESPSSELSPEDREFRRRGPNHVDLDHWAVELRKMGAMQADHRQLPRIYRRALHRHNEPSGSDCLPTLSKQPVVEDSDSYASSIGQLQSRFSSSSSSGASSILQTPPRTSHTNPTPSLASSTDRIESRPATLDHEYHQRNLHKGSAKTHRRQTSSASTDDSSRRKQHARSASGLSVLVKRTTKAEEEDWMGELQRMEARERARQAEERRRASEL